MARGQRKGIGCGTIVLVLLVVLVAGAWGFGAIDRAIYLMHVDSAKTELFGQVGHAERGNDDSFGNVGDISDGTEEGRQAIGFVYAQLSDDDCEKYLVLLDAFQSREERAYPETDLDDLARIRDCVLADHPELFYIDGVRMQTTTNSVTGLVTNVTVEGQCLFSAEESAALRVQIEGETASCLAGLPDGADDFAKAKYFYEYLVANVEYDHAVIGEGAGIAGVTSGQTVADALVDGRAVCAGYARAYQYLLQQVGIPSVFVTGVARGSDHAWCAVYLDGYWYNVDPTWGDPQFLDDSGQAADYSLVNYDYLCVTDDDLAATHRVDCAYPLPECWAIADNYYVHEGLYLDWADVNEAGAIVEAAVERGDMVARFRCADREVYSQVVDALFSGQEIYRFIPGNSCSYVLNDDMCTVGVLY